MRRDYDPADRELTRRALRDSGVGIDLRVVPNGEAALDYLYRRGEFADSTHAPRPDLALPDLNMPRIDGRQVLQEMRGHRELRRIPVVVLTASQHDEDVIHSYL